VVPHHEVVGDSVPYQEVAALAGESVPYQEVAALAGDSVPYQEVVADSGQILHCDAVVHALGLVTMVADHRDQLVVSEEVTAELA